MERYAIIGFGCAGYHALKAMRDQGFEGEIHVYSELGDPPASPMLTTYYVSDIIPRSGLYPFGSLEEISVKYRAVIHRDCRVTALDPETKTVTLEDGKTERFDKILLSTGATPIAPDLGVGDSKRVFYMRSVADADRLRDALAEGQVNSAVVVGASMVGIKVAELLQKRGKHVLLMDLAPHIFSVAAFPDVAEEIERRVAAQGVSLLFGCGVKHAEETENSILTSLDNGKVLESDILVMCVGTRARTELVQGTAVNVQRGILVGDDMSTSVPGIYAAGDCTQGRNLMDNSQMIIGLWANAGYQGETAGRVMAGGHVEFTGNIPHNLTHFMGMDFVSFGDIRIQGETRRFGRPDGPTYIRVTVADDRVVAVNILDIYQVSGIIRNYMLGVLAGSKEPMSPALKGYLSQVDMEQEFIDLFRPTEGDQHDGT